MLASVSLAGGAVALASGSGNSAGDNQYVDPLTSTTATPTTTSAAPTTTTPATSTAPPPSSSADAGSNTTAASSESSTTGTLPFTGLNLWACIAVGVGMLAAGIGLRHATRSV